MVIAYTVMPVVGVVHSWVGMGKEAAASAVDVEEGIRMELEQPFVDVGRAPSAVVVRVVHMEPCVACDAEQ